MLTSSEVLINFQCRAKKVCSPQVSWLERVLIIAQEYALTSSELLDRSQQHMLTSSEVLINFQCRAKKVCSPQVSWLERVLIIAQEYALTSSELLG